jgi:hypothetical protein
VGYASGDVNFLPLQKTVPAVVEIDVRSIALGDSELTVDPYDERMR